MKTQSMHTNRRNMRVVASTAKQEQNIETEERKCPQMLSIVQIARKSGLSYYAVRSFVKSGACPHVTVGNRSYISWNKFCEFLESNMGGKTV